MGAPEHGLSQVEVHDKSGQLMSAASLATNYLGLLPIRLFAYSPVAAMLANSFEKSAPDGAMPNSCFA